MSKYDDIINIPRWNPKSHTRMSEYERAAQFAPFAALTGYDDMVAETARRTDEWTEPDEGQRFQLNETLNYILEHIAEEPAARIRWFRRDSRKTGGSYVETEGNIHDVDTAARRIIMKDGSRIALDAVCGISLCA